LIEELTAGTSESLPPVRLSMPFPVEFFSHLVAFGRYFIDASYEGDVLVAAGVSFAYGRESREQYNESYAGVTAGSIAKFNPPISPFVKDGMPELLPWVQYDQHKLIGDADDNVMAFSYRVCLTTDANNMVPITAPPGYDPKDFELPRRYLLTELAKNITPSTPWGDLTYHGCVVRCMHAHMHTHAHPQTHTDTHTHTHTTFGILEQIRTAQQNDEV